MTGQTQLIWGVFVGAIALAVIELASDDWRSEAAAHEEQQCQDRPDTAAYLARRPGENHNVEHCIQVPRYGDPHWIPDFQSPLGPPGPPAKPLAK